MSLLYFAGCPHRTLAEQRLYAALAAVGRTGEPVRHVLVENSEDADLLGFVGSPTILVDGKDPFRTGYEKPAFACRVYTTPEGLAGSPSVQQLVEVLA